MGCRQGGNDAMQRRAGALGFIYAALVLYGAIGVALADPPSQADASGVYNQPATNGYGSKPTTATRSPDQAKASPDSWDYQRPCEHPESREQSDLCQQWRMAKASEDMVQWSRRQVWATSWEIGLLAMTLAFTGWAAWAAGRAATEAAKANVQSRETLITDQRPWVCLEKFEPATNLHWDDSQCFITLGAFMKNVDKSPALNVEVWVRLTTETSERALEREQIAFADEIRNSGKELNITIFPSETTRFEAIGSLDTEMMKMQLASRHIPWASNTAFNIFVLGCIDYYSEIGKRTHQTGFIYMIENRLAMDERVDPPRFRGAIPRDEVRLHRWPITGRTD
jgi:hypothetical protein